MNVEVNVIDIIMIRKIAVGLLLYEQISTKYAVPCHDSAWGWCMV